MVFGFYYGHFLSSFFDNVLPFGIDFSKIRMYLG